MYCITERKARGEKKRVVNPTGTRSEMCGGSKARSYLRLIDCVFHSTLCVRVIKKQRSHPGGKLVVSLVNSHTNATSRR